jgi:hypothetical protein
MHLTSCRPCRATWKRLVSVHTGFLSLSLWLASSSRGRWQQRTALAATNCCGLLTHFTKAVTPRKRRSRIFVHCRKRRHALRRRCFYLGIAALWVYPWDRPTQSVTRAGVGKTHSKDTNDQSASCAYFCFPLFPFFRRKTLLYLRFEVSTSAGMITRTHQYSVEI